MRKKTITVNDKFQKDYKYQLWVYGEPKEVVPVFKFGKREFPESRYAY